MPGSSLWLLPPAGHPLAKVLPSLIDQTSTHFKSAHRFLPHVTLTSEISPSTYTPDAGEWLDSLEISFEEQVLVTFKRLDSENVFVRKLYIQCGKTDSLKELAQSCRQHVQGFSEFEAAQKWVQESFNPHLSLLYHDCPVIDKSGLSQVEEFAAALVINLNGQGELGGWTGGRIILVPTDRPIEQWTPIAERIL